MSVSAEAAGREHELAALFRERLRNEAATNAIARGARIADETDYESAFSGLLGRERDGPKWSQVLGSVVVFVAGGLLAYGIAKIVQLDWAGGGVEIAIVAVVLGLLGVLIRFMLRPI